MVLLKKSLIGKCDKLDYALKMCFFVNLLLCNEKGEASEITTMLMQRVGSGKVTIRIERKLDCKKL